MNLRIRGTLWSLGKRCKDLVYTNESTYCSIIYTAELAQKCNGLCGERGIVIQLGLFPPFSPRIYPHLLPRWEQQEFRGEEYDFLQSQPRKLGNIEVTVMSQQKQDREKLQCLTRASSLQLWMLLSLCRFSSQLTAMLNCLPHSHFLCSAFYIHIHIFIFLFTYSCPNKTLP